MVWRRGAAKSACLHGWMLLSLLRSAASARSSAAREVMNRFISVLTLAGSWITETVLNIEVKKKIFLENGQILLPVQFSIVFL